MLCALRNMENRNDIVGSVTFSIIKGLYVGDKALVGSYACTQNFMHGCNILNITLRRYKISHKNKKQVIETFPSIITILDIIFHLRS